MESNETNGRADLCVSEILLKNYHKVNSLIVFIDVLCYDVAKVVLHRHIVGPLPCPFYLTLAMMR